MCTNLFEGIPCGQRAQIKQKVEDKTQHKSSSYTVTIVWVWFLLFIHIYINQSLFEIGVFVQSDKYFLNSLFLWGYLVVLKQNNPSLKYKTNTFLHKFSFGNKWALKSNWLGTLLKHYLLPRIVRIYRLNFKAEIPTLNGI